MHLDKGHDGSVRAHDPHHLKWQRDPYGALHRLRGLGKGLGAQAPQGLPMSEKSLVKRALGMKIGCIYVGLRILHHNTHYGSKLNLIISQYMS